MICISSSCSAFFRSSHKESSSTRTAIDQPNSTSPSCTQPWLVPMLRLPVSEKKAYCTLLFTDQLHLSSFEATYGVSVRLQRRLHSVLRFHRK